MCSLAIQSEPVVKRLNAIFEDHVLKDGHNEMEKCVNEAYKVRLSLVSTNDLPSNENGSFNLFCFIFV